jgi:hypothetical protein
MTGFGSATGISTVTEMLTFGMAGLYLLLLLAGLVICVIHRRLAPGTTLLIVGFALEILGWLLSVAAGYLIHSSWFEVNQFEQLQRIYIGIRLVAEAGLGLIVWGLAAVLGHVRRKLKVMGQIDGADDFGRRASLPFDADRAPLSPSSRDIHL